MRLIDILKMYSAGELTLDQANEALKDKGFSLNPDKNTITEAERMDTVVGETPAEATGWGLLDSGTGSLDKVFVRNGKLVNCDMGEAFALCIIGGKSYEVKGDTLI